MITPEEFRDICLSYGMDEITRYVQYNIDGECIVYYDPEEKRHIGTNPYNLYYFDEHVGMLKYDGHADPYIDTIEELKLNIEQCFARFKSLKKEHLIDRIRKETEI